MPLISPKEFLGFAPGADRCLADWDQMLAYFKTLAASSDRVTMDQLGLTTEALPFVQLIITSPANHARLDEYRQIQARLADPRGLSEVEADQLISQGKTIVMISCGVHSTEIAGVQYSLDLAYELASGEDAHTHQILDNVILILVPSLNPDGHKMVVDWYRQNLGTPYEGCPMPWLYQKYVGHDNNRDWYMCTQVENRLAVEKIHNVWHPQVVYDMHQMGPTTARFFIPPYVDPIDPNVDPILQQEIVWIGSTMANQLTAEGKSGVVIHAIYDAWTPARAYQHYHGGIRILTEAASVKIATPVTVPFDQLTTGIGYDAKKQTWNHPMPWPGGEWHLSDIVDYERSASHALLTHTARYRDTWLRNFYCIGRNATNRKIGPYAFFVPIEQKDPATTAKLLSVLHTGLVELHRADEPFTVDGVEYGAGSVVVLYNQPYGAFAKTLLETQHYPDIRQYPGGPPQRPYDVTAQTLPLLMGVKVATAAQPFTVKLSLLDAPQPPRYELQLEGPKACYMIKPSQNEAFTLANRLVKAGKQVGRSRAGFTSDGAQYPAGSWVIKAGQDGVQELIAEAARNGLKVEAANTAPAVDLQPYTKVRLGIYQSWTGSMDEGWLRFVLEQFGYEFTRLTNEMIRAGDLAESCDAIILPSSPGQVIMNGFREGMVPPQYAGGIGDQGLAELKTFAEQGGTLIALDQAAAFAADKLDLPAHNILGEVPPEQFYVPGSLIRVLTNPEHPLGYGTTGEDVIWFMRSPAFALDAGRSVVNYPATNLLQSGWLLGESHLHGRSALAEIPQGQGRVVLFGFTPHYRAQAHDTYKLLFNAIAMAGR